VAVAVEVEVVVAEVEVVVVPVEAVGALVEEAVAQEEEAAVAGAPASAPSPEGSSTERQTYWTVRRSCHWLPGTEQQARRDPHCTRLP